MVFSLATFNKRIHSIARNQYYLIRIPSIATDNEIITALSRNTVIPANNHTTIPVPYRGLESKIVDKPVFDTWTVNFLCDEAHALRNIFLKWQSRQFNVNTLQNFGHNDYKADGISVSQLAADGSVTHTTIMRGCFPSIVGEIALDQAGGALEVFDVTFSYDDHVHNDLGGDVISDDVDVAVNDDGLFDGVTIKGLAGVKFQFNPS